MSLKIYRQKRNFHNTPEPKGAIAKKRNSKVSPSKQIIDNKHIYIIQKHAASHLHYDFRLELKGVLKSWAIPKGPSLDPKVKRLAMHVEDHPIEYASFEGIIPPGQYGAGTVILWDKGHWTSLDKNPYQAYLDGNMKIEIAGEKLQGQWKLVRIGKDGKSWLLMKVNDQYAKSKDHYDITTAKPNSVLSQQSLEEVKENYQYIWHNRGVQKLTKGQLKTRLNSRIKKLSHNPAESLSLNQLSIKKPIKKKNKKSTQKSQSFTKFKTGLPKSAYPRNIFPALATLVDEPPLGDNWLHEIKFDGYRLIVFKKDKKINLMTRNQNNWTHKFQDIAAAINLFLNKNAVLDGEVVVLDDNERPNFQMLQNSIKMNQGRPFIYYVYDILYYDQYDLTSLPLLKRKNILQNILRENQSTNIMYSDHIVGYGKEMLQKICDLGFEGIVSKEIDSSYIQKRSKTWLKIKCLKRQEFVIGGYKKPQGKRKYFGSLLLGTYNKRKELIYNGNVGTGFTEASLANIYQLLSKYETSKMPFHQQPPGSRKDVIWLKPLLVAEVEFSEWTNDDYVRNPSFKGLRNDKSPQQIVREKEVPIENIENKQDLFLKEEKSQKLNSNYRLTNPHKILYPEDHITKKEFALYYKNIHAWILPYIVNRPLSLYRCPDGYQKECFFQKHINDSTPSALYAITIQEKDSKEECIYIKDDTGLMALAQMGALEIHPWGSRIEDAEYPDVIVFDLDPGPDVPWKKVVEAAFDVKELLTGFKLQSFVKTTGGKGLHVVVPIKPQYTWQEIKLFTRLVAHYIVQQNPQQYVCQMTKSKRTGKVFVDYLRNQRGATAIAPYSTRARAHAPVAVPLAWDELTDSYQDTSYTIRTIMQRLNHLSKDPWRNFFKIKQSLDLDQLK